MITLQKNTLKDLKKLRADILHGKDFTRKKSAIVDCIDFILEANEERGKVA